MDASRFDDLLRLWQDDEASAADLAELATLLKGDPALRRELVLASLLEVHLYRRYAPSAPARKSPRWRPLEAAAALIVLGVSTFLLGRLFVRHEEPVHRVAAGDVWSQGASVATLREGRAFEVRGKTPASLRLKDGSLALLAPGSAGLLGAEGGFELDRGSGSFSLHGPHHLTTPAGTLSVTDSELQIFLRKLPRELTVLVTRGSAEIDSFGQHARLSSGQRQTFGPPAPPGGLDYARLLEGASLDLLGAIDRATALVPGIPINAALEDEDGRAVFSVSVAWEGRVREFDFDVKTGKVLEDDTEEEDRSRLAVALRTPLKDAIGKAIESHPGRPVEAEAEFKNGRPRIELRILTEDGVRKVLVDGETGEIRSEKK
jgi:uncharacterized membrane protein YkoI